MFQNGRRQLLSLTKASHLLQTNQITPTELCLYCHNLAIYGETTLGLNAFSHLVPLDTILQQASESEQRRRDWKYSTTDSISSSSRASLSIISPLDGIPISIKCNIAVKDLPLTASSDILVSPTYRNSNTNNINIRDSDESNTNKESITTKTSIGCGYDSYVATQLLREKGAILIGLTNMDEFGMGSLGTNVHGLVKNNDDTHNSNYEQTFVKNPIPYLFSSSPSISSSSSSSYNNNNNRYDDDQFWVYQIKNQIIPQQLEQHQHQHFTISAGGSSAGSATSVSFGSSLASIGTDTGGSVRLPAAWCGVVGLKPSYGLISRHGVVSYASSLDTVGIIAPTVSCAAIVLDELANRIDDDDNGDRNSDEQYYLSDSIKDSTATCIPRDMNLKKGISENLSTNVPQQSNLISKDCLKGIKIGIPAAFVVEECPDHIQSSWESAIMTLQNYGATIQTISSESLSPDIVKASLSAYYVLACAEASSNLSRYDGLRYGMTLDPNDMASKNNEESTNTSSISAHKSLPMTPLEEQFSLIRGKGFSLEVIRRILCGTAVLSSDRFHTMYEGAAKVRATITKQFNRSFKQGDSIHKDENKNDIYNGDDNDSLVDLMIIPTALTDPPFIGSEVNLPDPTEAFLNDLMTVPLSLAGIPSISIPIPRSRKSVHNIDSSSQSHDDIFYHRNDKSNGDEVSYIHPVIGMQIFGSKLSESKVLKAAHVLEHDILKNQMDMQ